MDLFETGIIRIGVQLRSYHNLTLHLSGWILQQVNINYILSVYVCIWSSYYEQVKNEYRKNIKSNVCSHIIVVIHPICNVSQHPGHICHCLGWDPLKILWPTSIIIIIFIETASLVQDGPPGRSWSLMCIAFDISHYITTLSKCLPHLIKWNECQQAQGAHCPDIKILNDHYQVVFWEK